MTKFYFTESERFVEYSPKYIEDIQIYGMNMPFISSREARKCIFHEWRMHMPFISSREARKCIFHSWLRHS